MYTVRVASRGGQLGPLHIIAGLSLLWLTGCGQKATQREAAMADEIAALKKVNADLHTQLKEAKVAKAGSAGAGAAGEEQPKDSRRDLAIQSVGYKMGERMGLDVGLTDSEVDQLLIGMGIAIRGEDPPTDSDSLQRLGAQIMQRKYEQRKHAAAKASSGVNSEFFAELDAREGVVKTASGLYYEIEKEGSERRAGDGDSVEVHYHGTLVNGTVFDSSVDRGKPATFPLAGVIAGFREGLKLVGEGGKVKLYIPSELGYGNNPRAGGPIKPGDTLIFDVEIIKVNP